MVRVSDDDGDDNDLSGRLSCNARNQSLHPIGDERAGLGRCA